MLHLPVLHKNQGRENFNPSDPDLDIPTYQNPIPAKVPDPVFDKTGGGYEAFFYHASRFPESKGIIVNSFEELEPYAVNAMGTGAYPTVYPVGPLLNHKNRNQSTGSTAITNCLDKQPSKSVLFLCFSRGTFNQLQIEQIAFALEASGHRFLWLIRQPLKYESPTNYTSYDVNLPDGFFERVKERGMVCGWAPQFEVLAHGAIKGFVNH